MEIKVWLYDIDTFTELKSVIAGALSDWNTTSVIGGYAEYKLYSINDRKYVAVKLHPIVFGIKDIDMVVELPNNVSVEEYLNSITYAILSTIIDRMVRELPDNVKVGFIRKREVPNDFKRYLRRVQSYLGLSYSSLTYKVTSVAFGTNLVVAYIDVPDDSYDPYIY